MKTKTKTQTAPRRSGAAKQDPVTLYILAVQDAAQKHWDLLVKEKGHKIAELQDNSRIRREIDDVPFTLSFDCIDVPGRETPEEAGQKLAEATFRTELNAILTDFTSVLIEMFESRAKPEWTRKRIKNYDIGRRLSWLSQHQDGSGVAALYAAFAGKKIKNARKHLFVAAGRCAEELFLKADYWFK